MSDIWSEFARRAAHWRKAGDVERLEMTKLCYQASPFHETDPEQALVLFTRGRDEARRLKEPWWELFFEQRRLGALTGDLEDYARALPLAMELMVRFTGVEGQAHPARLSILIEALNTYSNIDPLGYREELERGYAHLDGQIARDPDTLRFILYHRWTEYLNLSGRYDEAFELTHRTLALADKSERESTRIWHGAWALYYHCRTCHALGRMDELAGHALHMAELSEKAAQLRRTQADGWLWLAATQRASGKEREASHSFRRGMRLLKGLECCDTISADPMALYYEQSSEWKEALGVRDRELTAITKKGMLHRCCLVQIERCRLLAQVGELAAGDIDQGRRLAAQMRTPDWYLEKLARINPSDGRAI